MQASRPPEPIIGRWNPHTEIGRYVRTRFGWLCTISTLLMAISYMAFNAQLSPPFFVIVASLPMVLVPLIKDSLKSRAAKRIVARFNKGELADVFLHYGDGVFGTDFGVMWFEGRYMHFTGANSEFRFDVNRLEDNLYSTKSQPQPVAVKSLSFGGITLFMTPPRIQNRCDMASFSECIQQASHYECDSAITEVLPPFGESGYAWLPVSSGYVASMFCFAGICLVSTLLVQVYGNIETFFFAGPAGALAFGMIAIVSFLDLRRYRRDESRSMPAS